MRSPGIVSGRKRRGERGSRYRHTRLIIRQRAGPVVRRALGRQTGPSRSRGRCVSMGSSETGTERRTAEPTRKGVKESKTDRERASSPPLDAGRWSLDAAAASEQQLPDRSGKDRDPTGSQPPVLPVEGRTRPRDYRVSRSTLRAVLVRHAELSGSKVMFRTIVVHL